MKKIPVIIFLACICFFLNSSFAYSENRGFLRIPGISGDVTVSGYVDWIEVLSWSWQMSSTDLGGTEKAIIRPLVVVKRIDRASPIIAIDLLNGSTFADVDLVFVTVGDKLHEYFRVKMWEVQFVNVSPAGSYGDPLFLESVALAFSRVCYEYSGLDAIGNPSASIKRCWDIGESEEF